MNVQKAINELQKDVELSMRCRKNSGIDGKSPNVIAMEMAIQSLEMQDKLKQWIENYKNPEFKDVTITRDGLIDILEEFRLECETEC